MEDEKEHTYETKREREEERREEETLKHLSQIEVERSSSKSEGNADRYPESDYHIKAGSRSN